MIRLTAVVVFLLTLQLASLQLYDPATHYLGNNLILNPDFSSPALPNGTISQNYTSIPGWTCGGLCQLKNIPLFFLSQGDTVITNLTQGLNLDLNGQLPDITQDLTIPNTTNYLLRIEWMTAPRNIKGKFIYVGLNGTAALDTKTHKVKLETQIF